jgi:hypothetical protein
MDWNIGNCGWFGCRWKNVFYANFALVAAICVAPVMEASSPTIEEEVQLLMNKCDVGQAASCSARDRFFSRGFAIILQKNRENLISLKPEPITDPMALEALEAARRPSALVMELYTLLSAMVVISSDHTIEIAPGISKMFYDKPTIATIYKEVARLSLEQILPFAFWLECFENFVKIPTQRTSDILFELVTQHLKTCAPHIEALPDDDSPRKEFSAKHGQLIIEAICSVISDYAKLFHLSEGNCAACFIPKIVAKTTKLMASLSAPSRMPLSALTTSQETLTGLIIGAIEAVLQISPKKSVFDISADATALVLQFTLPVISCAGQLWGLGNGLKSESSFGKMLKTAIQDSKEIMAQISDAKGKEKSSDAEDSEKGKKKKAPSSAKNLAKHIITQIRKKTAKYFDVFGKRETFGSIASPL